MTQLTGYCYCVIKCVCVEKRVEKRREEQEKTKKSTMQLLPETKQFLPGSQ